MQAKKSEEELRLHRCCFTGHRPEKLRIPPQKIKREIEIAVEQAVADGYTTFICGLARGFDLWAGKCVIYRKIFHPEIKLIAAVPFEGMEKSWSKEWQDIYCDVLRRADLVKYICDSYSVSAYDKRNRWMVDHSSRVIAAYNGTPGGTKNTVEYAKTQNVLIINICT